MILANLLKEEVSVVIAYTDCESGEEIDYMPANIKKLAKCKPVLKTFKGWKQDTTKCTTVFIFLIL